MKWLLIIAILFGAFVCGPRRRGIVRHKDQKSFRAIAHTDSQTSKEETDTNSVARDFAETKESFSESIADRDAQEQIKAQKNNSDPNTRGRRKSIRDSGTNACSGKRKAGRTLHFRLIKLRITTVIRQKFARSSTPGSR